ncbi:hypothetical protein VU01_14562 [Candidatus Electrothrix marina]|uniref:Uncharacterized protein n=1 Tax=Candidatus Electrothrix marina TaxID=1859130 RepID=A0A444J9J1_9BACT|nr:hypothetical protein VU01_14562 [Candidatus Electrothrix marina]
MRYTDLLPLKPVQLVLVVIALAGAFTLGRCSGPEPVKESIPVEQQVPSEQPKKEKEPIPVEQQVPSEQPKKEKEPIPVEQQAPSEQPEKEIKPIPVEQ